MHDTSPGIGAFYHSYKVYYKGYSVGRLHTATKLKKHELQFDFAKEVFYSFSPEFWYEVHQALKSELGIIYNNISYMEISVDTDKNLVEPFSYYYKNARNNNLRSSERYKMRKNTIVHVMNNGSSFLIAGSENEIVIYDKLKYAEKYIHDYFTKNGLVGKEIHRIESRLRWNYIRHLRNKKRLDINIETLLDQRKLAAIFLLSTLNKITFQDQTVKMYDENRNPHFLKVSILDNLAIESAEIGKLNDSLRINHYKTESVDENILRQNYYRFLETGNPEYLHNLKASGKVAGFNKDQLVVFIGRFNNKYMGNRTKEILQRMENALKYFFCKPQFKFGEVFYALGLKLRWKLMGFL